MIRRLERFSRPRLRFLFDHRLSNVVFGLLVIGGSVGAFLAPPFTGLDTLPSLGVVLLSLGVLLEDVVVVLVALLVGVGRRRARDRARQRRGQRHRAAVLGTATPYELPGIPPHLSSEGSPVHRSFIFTQGSCKELGALCSGSGNTPRQTQEVPP